LSGTNVRGTQPKVVNNASTLTSQSLGVISVSPNPTLRASGKAGPSNVILASLEPYRKASGKADPSGNSSASPEPHDVIKAPNPYNVSMRAPNPYAPSGTFSASPRDVWRPLAKPRATGALTASPIPTDGTEMTVHSEQEHGNRTLIQHDPGHSTMTISIPLQRRG
jgi:hypothetical protein